MIIVRKGKLSLPIINDSSPLENAENCILNDVLRILVPEVEPNDEPEYGTSATWVDCLHRLALAVKEHLGRNILF